MTRISGVPDHGPLIHNPSGIRGRGTSVSLIGQGWDGWDGTDKEERLWCCFQGRVLQGGVED